jgi:hypothetical protein
MALFHEHSWRHQPNTSGVKSAARPVSGEGVHSSGLPGRNLRYELHGGRALGRTTGVYGDAQPETGTESVRYSYGGCSSEI